MFDIGTIWQGLVELSARGGGVLMVIMAVTFVMWTLIIERSWYLKFGYEKEAAQAEREWALRTDHRSRAAREIRYAMVSRLAIKLGRSLGMISALVAVCPLLGLLGTVTGMIEVFDVMAMLGSNDPRAMAAGVSKATIPTLAGMVAALSGYYFGGRLRRVATVEIQTFADRLTADT